MTETGDDRGFRSFLLLFEWLYSINFRPDDRQRIVAAVREALDESDVSGMQLTEYVVRVATQAAEVAEEDTDHTKRQLHEIFARAFSRNESNGRGRILFEVYRAVELCRPGATGVAPLPEPSPFRERAVAPPAPPTPAPAAPKSDHGDFEAELKRKIEDARHDINMGIIRNM